MLNQIELKINIGETLRFKNNQFSFSPFSNYSIIEAHGVNVETTKTFINNNDIIKSGSNIETWWIFHFPKKGNYYIKIKSLHENNIFGYYIKVV